METASNIELKFKILFNLLKNKCVFSFAELAVKILSAFEEKNLIFKLVLHTEKIESSEIIKRTLCHTCALR